MLIDIPTPQQSAMIHFNDGSSQFIVKYIYLSDSKGVQAAQNRSSQLIVDSVAEDSSKNPGHGPNQHESSGATLLAVQPNSHKSNETHRSSLFLIQSEGAGFAPTTTFQAFE